MLSFKAGGRKELMTLLRLEDWKLAVSPDCFGYYGEKSVKRRTAGYGQSIVEAPSLQIFSRQLNP